MVARASAYLAVSLWYVSVRARLSEDSEGLEADIPLLPNSPHDFHRELRPWLQGHSCGSPTDAAPRASRDWLRGRPPSRL